MNKICGCTDCWAYAEFYDKETDQYFCREHWSTFTSSDKQKEKFTVDLLPTDDFEFFQMIEIFRK